MYNLNGAGHMGGISFFWIIGIFTIVTLAWAMSRILRHNRQTCVNLPEELLKRRFVNGEINKDFYEKCLHDLRQ